MRKIIGLSFNYKPTDLNDGIFRHCPTAIPNRIRDAFAAVGVVTHTVDLVDPRSPETIAVIYFDFNWRHWLHEKRLKGIPFEKRVLVYLEPRNINPSAYYIPFFRNHFSKVFTYDERLLASNPSYIRHCVVPFGEFENYTTNPYADIPFAQKKLICAVSMNRWSYMPQSTYGFRKSAYAWFCKHQPNQFDLFGKCWNEPVIFYQKWFGHPTFSCYRGPISGPWSNKLDKMAHYKFALCFENNANAPGYISEKIRDCFCSRCVPIYYGSAGVEKHIPRECFIDMHDFKSFAALNDFIVNMPESEHQKYIDAINRFIVSPQAKYFSAKNFTDIIVKGILGDAIT